ncbi:uncharacterized protein TNCV_2268371 [Trichonephila clavipes]|nr:uncharacterized protein TNCV_2268371 [Trichonephila clavipes]
MDVQESLNAMTTMTDLRSAVQEFSECRRRSDFQLGQYNSILDQTSDTLTLENSSLQEEEGPKRSLPRNRGPVKDNAKIHGYGSGFNNVTPELVREFKNEAYAHLKQIQTSRVEYGYLFNIIDERDGISHAVYIKHEQFPLMEGYVLPEIYAIADKLTQPNTDMHDATCLYLLIFFALLVNRHSNWATMDYLTHCKLNIHTPYTSIGYQKKFEEILKHGKEYLPRHADD